MDKAMPYILLAALAVGGFLVWQKMQKSKSDASAWTMPNQPPMVDTGGGGSSNKGDPLAETAIQVGGQVIGKVIDLFGSKLAASTANL